MLCAKYYKGSSLRAASTWSLRDLFGLKRTGPEGDGKVSIDEANKQSNLSHEELLQEIACKNIAELQRDSWKKAGLGNTHLKWKILSEYEATFRRSIPNHRLGHINTFNDLLEVLEQSKKERNIPKIYPHFDPDSLPVNLSVQFINTAPVPKPDREPFQNYDARRPEYAKMLSPAQKAMKRRKRVGRHLTRWK